MPRPTFHLIFCCFAAWLQGCNTTPERVVDPTPQQMKKLLRVYNTYTTTVKQPPRSLAELKAFCARQKIEDAEALFISPRDGQPFVVLWSFDVRRRNAGAEGGLDKMSAEQAGAVLAYEAQGLGGQRFVLFTHGGTQLMSDDNFRKSRFFGGHKPD